MKTLPLGPLYYDFSRHHEIRLRIQPGDTIPVDTNDPFPGQVRPHPARRAFAADPLDTFPGPARQPSKSAAKSGNPR